MVKTSASTYCTYTLRDSHSKLTWVPGFFQKGYLLSNPELTKLTDSNLDLSRLRHYHKARPQTPVTCTVLHLIDIRYCVCVCTHVECGSVDNWEVKNELRRQ